MQVGQFVGRSPFAGVCIDDPRVSEAQALLSLRAGLLRFISLRRRLVVDGRPVEDVVVEPGLCIELAPDLVLEVLDLEPPSEVLALEGPGLARQLLPELASLWSAPDPTGSPRLLRGHHAGADVHFWSLGEGYRMRRADEDSPVQAGLTFEVGGRAFVISAFTNSEFEVDPTLPSEPTGIRLIARWDTVHFLRNDSIACVLDGVAARIVSELVRFRLPVDWMTLATEVWTGESDWELLRWRLDANLSRLRRKLRSAGLPNDLIRSNRSGQVELLLGPSDVAVDDT